MSEVGRNGRVASVVRFVNDILLSAPSVLVGLFVYLQLALPGLLPPLPAASALVELLRAAAASLLGAVESTFFDLLDWTRWLGGQALSATPGWADAVAPLTVSLLALLGFEWHARRVQRPALSPLATRRIA
ncbi:MAG: hypothetical protein HXY24_14950 [Rubrivivax sp.]|nr:hypothetical protein [Rubrivivax sp.]